MTGWFQYYPKLLTTPKNLGDKRGREVSGVEREGERILTPHWDGGLNLTTLN